MRAPRGVWGFSPRKLLKSGWLDLRLQPNSDDTLLLQRALIISETKEWRERQLGKYNFQPVTKHYFCICLPSTCLCEVKSAIELDCTFDEFESLSVVATTGKPRYSDPFIVDTLT